MKQTLFSGAGRIVGIAVLCGALAVGVNGTVHGQEPEPRHWGIAPIPIVGYTPDDGGIFGISTFLFYGPDVGVEEDKRTGARTNILGLNGVYTTSGSFALAVSTSNFFAGDRYRLDTGISGSSSPGVYYGEGPRSDADDAEDFVAEGFAVSLGASVQIVPDLFIGPLVEVQQLDVDADDDATMIDDEDVDLYGGGAQLIWDTTGGAFYPTHGVNLSTSARQYTNGFGLYVLNLRGFRTVWSEHIIAGQLLYRQSWGDTVWLAQPAVGGDNLFRGVPAQRFKDDVAVTSQIEYRLQILSWLGAVAFASIGQVGDSVADLNWTRPIIAGGGGLRFTINKSEHLNIRLDIAVSPEGAGPYVAAGEAF